MGGFQNRKKTSVTFNPLRDAKRTNLYFMQIRSRHVHTGDVDNSHAICIFDQLIFDVNIECPLRLNADNLDLCCLGDLWVYDSPVRVEEFTPTTGVAKFIEKYLSLSLPIVVH